MTDKQFTENRALLDRAEKAEQRVAELERQLRFIACTERDEESFDGGIND